MLGVVTVILEKEIFEIYSAIQISNCTRLCVKIASVFPILSDTIPINMLANPNSIIAPDSGTAKIFEIKNTVDISLKFSIVTGNTIICADIVTASIVAIFSLIYFFKNFDIGLLKVTIPNVPKYDSCNPTSFIANGLSIKIINKEIDMDM